MDSHNLYSKCFDSDGKLLDLHNLHSMPFDSDGNPIFVRASEQPMPSEVRLTSTATLNYSAAAPFDFLSEIKIETP